MVTYKAQLTTIYHNIIKAMYKYLKIKNHKPLTNKKIQKVDTIFIVKNEFTEQNHWNMTLTSVISNGVQP